jgi:hypothetical protein
VGAGVLATRRYFGTCSGTQSSLGENILEYEAPNSDFLNSKKEEKNKKAREWEEKIKKAKKDPEKVEGKSLLEEE